MIQKLVLKLLTIFDFDKKLKLLTIFEFDKKKRDKLTDGSQLL